MLSTALSSYPILIVFLSRLLPGVTLLLIRHFLFLHILFFILSVFSVLLLPTLPFLLVQAPCYTTQTALVQLLLGSQIVLHLHQIFKCICNFLWLASLAKTKEQGVCPKKTQ